MILCKCVQQWHRGILIFYCADSESLLYNVQCTYSTINFHICVRVEIDPSFFFKAGTGRAPAEIGIAPAGIAIAPLKSNLILDRTM